MNQRNKIKLLIFLLSITCTLFSKGTYIPKTFNATISLGHDSNPLRLSKNEIEELSDRSYLLGDASEVYSRFLGISGKFSFYSNKAILARVFKRKTNFNLGYTYKYFTQNKEKN